MNRTTEHTPMGFRRQGSDLWHQCCGRLAFPNPAAAPEQSGEAPEVVAARPASYPIALGATRKDLARIIAIPLAPAASSGGRSRTEKSNFSSNVFVFPADGGATVTR